MGLLRQADPTSHLECTGEDRVYSGGGLASADLPSRADLAADEFGVGRRRPAG
jgi:hypothetical protein